MYRSPLRAWHAVLHFYSTEIKHFTLEEVHHLNHAQNYPEYTRLLDMTTPSSKSRPPSLTTSWILTNSSIFGDDCEPRPQCAILHKLTFYCFSHNRTLFIAYTTVGQVHDEVMPLFGHLQQHSTVIVTLDGTPWHALKYRTELNKRFHTFRLVIRSIHSSIAKNNHSCMSDSICLK